MSTNTRTPEGAIFIKIDNTLWCALHTKPEDRKRAEGIAAETRKILIRQHGEAAQHDIGHATACEMITTLTLVAAAQKAGDTAKVERLNKEATAFAISLQVFEKSPYIEITHYPKAQMTGVRALSKLEGVA